MSDLVITDFGDAWINNNKKDVNYGSGTWIRVELGEKRGLVRPSLPNIAGRTVSSAVLVGHAAVALVAQTVTQYPLTERWSPGAVTWTKQPAYNAGAGVSAVIGATAAGATVQWTVTSHIQAVADGGDWFGWLLATNTATLNQAFRSDDSGSPAWELHITLSDTPDQPTDLRPNGGDIAVLAPVLSWEFGDAGLGDTAQAQFRVQVDTPAVGVDPDEVTPDFDSGWIVSPTPQYDLFASAFNLITNGDFETNTTGWSGGNATLAQSTAQAYPPSTGSLRATASIAAAMQAQTSGTGTGAVDVKPSTAYAIIARVRAATTGRNTNWQYTAYNSGGSSVTAPASGSAVADVATGWVENRQLFTTGATVEFLRAAFNVASPASGEQHYLDRVALVKGGDGPTFWRVTVRDADGNETAPSDWATYTFAQMPTLVVDSPTGAFGDPTPVVAAHLSSGTVASWEARVTGSDRSDVRYRTGARTGAVSFTVPLRGTDGRKVLKDDEAAWIYLRVYPAGTWVTSVGQPPYLETWVPVTWDQDLGITAPTALSVVPLAAGDPRSRWQWSRTSASAGGYVALVDGQTVFRLDAGDETSVGGGVYRYDDHGEIPPLRAHTVSIRALNAGDRSAAASVSNFSHDVSGVWLIPDDVINPIQLAGTGVGNFARTDYRATYTTSTGDEIDVIYGTPGRSGTFEGSIYVGNGWTEAQVWAAVDGIEALRASKIRTGRLVWGSQSASVRFRDVDVTPAENLLPNNLLHTVRFGFVEVLD